MAAATPDLMKLYEQASDWTVGKIKTAAEKVDATDKTPCDEWSLRQLLDHMLETQRYFISSGKGEDAKPPSSGTPPQVLSKDPVADFEQARADIMRTYADPDVVEKTGPALGIAFSDMLLHGWDVARATGQDATMPKGLAEAAYEMVHGKLTDEQRKGVFKPEVKVEAKATPQERLLAYTGRNPTS